MKDSTQDIKDIAEVTSSNPYEIGYILNPAIAEERLAVEAATLVSVLEKHGASITLSDSPKLRGLTYTIERSLGGKREKFDQGYFGWTKFMADPLKLDGINAELKLNRDIIRHMIIHANTKVSTRPPRRFPVKKSEAGTEEKVSEEQIDKEVESLIASTSAVNVSH